MTTQQIKNLQSHVGAVPDGFWGRMSIATCRAHLLALMPKDNPWPSTNKLQKFFGNPGDESELVNLPVDGLGVKYDGKVCRTVRCNAKVADSLLRIIKRMSVKHPEILADYNGCYNFRKMRGGSSYSLHAYGAAIDFMAGSNGNHTSWPIRATMPITAMEIFASEGWIPAGAFWGRDAMHFQSTH